MTSPPRGPCAGRAAAVLGLALLTLTAPRPAAGQGPATTPLERFRAPWRWAHFGPETGIPPGRPLEVLESDGTTWLATDLGVAWFDGFQWRRLLPPEGAAPTSPRRLTPDGYGGAWGIADSALVRVTREGVSAPELPGALAGARVRSVARIADDDLLLLVDSLVWRLHRGRAEPMPAPLAARALLGRGGGRLLRTRPGHVWLIGDGAWRWHPSGWQAWFDGPVNTLRETEAGGIITTAPPDLRLYEWSPGGRPRPGPVSTTPLGGISISPAGEVALASIDGRLSIRSGGAWSTLDRLLDEVEGVRQLVHRDNGDLWAIGARGVFLFRHSSGRWDRWTIPGRGERDGFVNEILIARSGDLWLGTGNGVVRRDAAGRLTAIETVRGTPLGPITALAEDAAGGIWIGSGDGVSGLYRFDGSTWDRFGPEAGLAAPRTHRLATDRQGGVWALGIDSSRVSTGGAYRWDGRAFTAVPELADRRVYAFAEGPDGSQWFGSNLGLSRRRAGRWTHWPAEPQGVGARVYALAVDSTGVAWFGHWFYGLGLGRVGADDSVHRVDLGDPGPRQEVTDLEIGPDGALWILTHGGVGRYADGSVSFLGRDLGMTETRVWPLAVLEDRVLIGADGLITLRLAEARDPPPQVAIDDPLTFGSGVLLRWTPRAWWGTVPSRLLDTRYRLDGQPWSPWGPAREMALYQVRAGEHRFTVQAKGIFGRVSTSTASVAFTVPPPWYRRWPFLSLAATGAVAFLALAGLYARRRIEHRRALERLNRALAADVEERRRTEAELEESRLVLQRIADSVPSILFLLTVPESKVLFVNRSVERVLGYPPRTMMAAQSLGDFMSPAVLEQARGYLKRVMAADPGSIVEGEAPMNTSDGRERIMRVRSTVFARRADGRAESMLSVAHDVTDERRLEAQLLQAQKMETVGRLAGGVAHDFNNILTAIAGYAELARDGVDPRAAVAADIAEISRAAERARLLTLQLLTFARRQMVEPQIVHLNALVTGVERMLRRLIGEDVSLDTELADDPWAVRVDPTQLEQVLVNLAVNARDAMPTGGRLTISTANVEQWDGSGLGGEHIEGPCVLLRVRDTGHGMPPEVAAQVFDPFFTTKGPGKGSGLGLSTCYGVVRQAGGVITVQTAPGAGATFTVALPRAAGEPAAHAADGNGGARPGGSELVLVVEDEDPVRRFTCRVLREAGYEVMEAANGRAAIELLAASGPRVPALLVSDVVMPEMGGPGLWETLRARNPSMRVLFVSGYTESAMLRDGMAGRSLPYLAKPFTPTGLTEKVREVLDA